MKLKVMLINGRRFGNAAMDDETDTKGMIDYAWHHGHVQPLHSQMCANKYHYHHYYY
jgi:hypothetical protein